MSDVLQILNDLTDRLWAKYGNPLATYSKRQEDIHMTYYVGRLMKELGHKFVMPARISGPKRAARVYYSEAALHDAFLAGQVLALHSNEQMRQTIRREVKAELAAALEDI